LRLCAQVIGGGGVKPNPAFNQEGKIMKNVLRGFAAFLLMVSIAFAASAKTVDLSKYASGDGWKQFSQALVADKMMTPGSDRFQTIGVSNIMYNALDEAQQGSVSRVGFHSLNMVVNNLPSEMTAGEWRNRSSNLKLPDVQVVAAAKTSTTPTTLVPAAAAPQVQTPTTPVVTAENVQQQLNALSKTVDSKYGGINRRVAELQTALKRAALKSDIAKIVAETQTITNLTARVGVVEQKVTALQQSVGTLDTQQREIAADVTELKAGQASISALWWAFGLIAIVALLALAFSLVAMSRRGGASKIAAAPASSGEWMEERIPPTFKVV
jgi:hypothetical protein